MKKYLFVVVVLCLMFVAGCIDVTPTAPPSVLPSPTAPSSVLPSPTAPPSVLPSPTALPSVLPSPTVSPLLSSDKGSKKILEETMMDAELLAGLFGIVLSLCFSYIPGLQSKFAPLDKSVKQAVMGVGLVVIALAVFGLSCGAIVDVGVACDKAGALGLVNILIQALIANQGVYLLTKK